MITFDSNQWLPFLIIGVLLAFFGLLILIIILVKRHVSSLQIKKDDIDEKTLVQQELDRVLVPIEDEKIKKEMDEAAQKEDSVKVDDAKDAKKD